MDREVLVCVDLDGAPSLVGRLWTRLRKNKETATFEYDADWLQHPARFSLDPALQLGPGPFHTVADMPMFGAIGDSAPDRWGRALMRRMERRRAEREGGPPRTLDTPMKASLARAEPRRDAPREGVMANGKPWATRLCSLMPSRVRKRLHLGKEPTQPESRCSDRVWVGC